MADDSRECKRERGTRRLTLRNLLLAGQIAICAVLVTSSLVAVRGLMRSLHSSFGFRPEHVMLAATDLHMAGYTGDKIPLMQRQMLEAAAAIPGVSAAGYVNELPLSLGAGDSFVYADSTTDYRPTNIAADAMGYNVSPDHFRAAGTRLLAGRSVTLHDDGKAPKVAVINQEFARKVFGSVSKSIGGHFKIWGGTRVEVVGVMEDGWYRTRTFPAEPGFSGGSGAGPAGDACVLAHRVSGNAEGSDGGARGGNSDDAAPGTGRCLDSGTQGADGRSDDSVAGRIASSPAVPRDFGGLRVS